MKKLGFDLYEGKPSEVGNKDNNNLFCEVERNNAGSVVKFKSILFSDGTSAVDSFAVAASNIEVFKYEDDYWINANTVPEGITSLLLPTNTALSNFIRMLEDTVIDCTNPIEISMGDITYTAFAIPSGTYEEIAE